MPLPAAKRTTLLRNIFPAAQGAIDIDHFRWHASAGERNDAFKLHASQALVLDVFGTLKMSEQRDAVLGAWAEMLGLPVGGPWAVELEWHDPANPLDEKQPTWADAVAHSPRALIFFEGKFTENDGGACSQTQRLRSGAHKGLRQCDGRYMWQTNPANGLEARCALTAKGIRYWEAIAQVFDYAVDDSYFECPFAGPWFQWMRNLTNCFASARLANLQPACVLAYAEAPSLPMAQRVHSAEWQKLQSHLQPYAISFQAHSYQSLIAHAQAAAPQEAVWPELAAWVQNKIDAVTRSRREAQSEL